MNRFLTTIAVCVLASAALARAQFGGGGRFDTASISSLVDRVHSDLDHAYGVWHFSKDDRNRLNHAEKELREFAQRWEDYRFDKGELDDAIGSVQRILDRNRLPQQDRDALSDDVNQLRRLREAYDRHEIEK